MTLHIEAYILCGAAEYECFLILCMSLNTTRATGTGSPCFALLEQPEEKVLYP